MGAYINKGNKGFEKYISQEYVDKTGLIAYINHTLNSADMLTCVTRPRRFGKSIAANMLCAYYDKSCDSSVLFDKYEIAGDASYREHLNKYPTIFLDITKFTTKYEGRDDLLEIIFTEVAQDVKNEYPDIDYPSDDIMDVLYRVSNHTHDRFVFIIDEWDALCREFDDKPYLLDKYVNLLRRMFKTSDTAEVFAGVYMTGILPIKKYGTQSALNDFREYSMTTPGPLAQYIGFTDDEVKALAEKHCGDYEELKLWYDGYELDSFNWKDLKSKPKKVAIYNPNSVMTAIRNKSCDNYWSKTESFESLQRYIDCNFTGVQEKIEDLISGKSIDVRVFTFGNDLVSIKNDDELFTLLIHLGYLVYDSGRLEAKLPNQEIRQEFIIALRNSKSHVELAQLVRSSDKILRALWVLDGEFVAAGIQEIHNHKIAPIHYNNEQSLRTTVRFALLSAVDYYLEIQELPAGKGYADIVYVPRYNSGRPALVVELKWNDTAEAAIAQIKRQEYPETLKSFQGDILLVGVNYDKDTKEHTCQIEKIQK